MKKEIERNGLKKKDINRKRRKVKIIEKIDDKKEEDERKLNIFAQIE